MAARGRRLTNKGFGKDAKAVVMHTFGASASLSDPRKKSGFTPEAVYAEAKKPVK
jgi:transketolase